ncbi:tsr1 ribosome assembly factor [Dermacentor variabilis]|uniref:tsr1 ribosome assembly factor n=1 Tax=Dermacentor variabilis TaxID=34621 RepID=UPI003F5C58B2
MALPSENVAHRPGAFKQQNKAHKHGRHRSNRSLESLSRGKVSLKAITRKNKHELKRQERKNQIQQLRKLKREEATERKRSLGGSGVPPFLTAIIPLHANEDPAKFLELVKSCDEEAVISESSQGYCHISLPRFKKRYSFVTPRPGDVYATLDAVKVADSAVLLYSLDGGYDDVGDTMLSILFAQGLPSAVHVVQGLEALPQKQRAEARKQVTKALESRFPGEKLRAVDKKEDGLLLLRQIADQKRRPISYRDSRPHMLAESVEFCPHESQNLVGTLKVSGYIRGKPLSVNSLIHIPGHGDFQMTQIDAPDDPHGLILKSRDTSKSVEMADLTPKLLEKADPLKQESLQSENVPDDMDAEQTWPTPEELAEAESAQSEAESRKKVVKKVPKGTSEYQACWIVDAESSGEGSDSGSESGDEEEGAGGFEPMDGDDEDVSDTDNATIADDTESISIAGGKEGYDNHLDLEEEKASLVRFREERMDQMFPDEIDTPLDRPARTRFARYRGLKSFHSSPWDPKENLPLDYARVFQFENFARTKKRVMSEEKEGAMPGWYVTIHIANVPRTVYDAFQTQGDPLVLFGLLSHEQKMSVLNVAIKRHPGYTDPIKSKERLVFHIGYRRFSACPIFSAHTNGDKQKYERFLRSDAVSVATMFAPIVFPPVSAVVFIEDENGQHRLVGSGAVLGANPDRVVIKRAVLSGHPFKINRKSAVVRYMFFNREDIMWFKPVELKTKYGRRGHIKEPLGTHGHMKCVFNGQLKSQDTVLMHLYKRMFPKWTYDPEVGKPVPYYEGHDSTADGEECKAFSLMD